MPVNTDRRQPDPVRQTWDEAVKWRVRRVIEARAKVTLCGHTPSDHPEFVEFLLVCGIDSNFVSPDSFLAFKKKVAV